MAETYREPVDLTLYDTSDKLREAGVVPLFNMSKKVACEKLRTIDVNGKSPNDLIDAMMESKVGEIDPELVRKNQANINDIKERVYSSSRSYTAVS